MGVIIPVGEYQANILFALAGDLEPMAVTLGLQSDVPGELPELVASDVESALGACGLKVAANILTGWTMTGTRVYRADAGGGYAVGEVLVSTAGTNAGSGPPNNVAFLIKKNTNSPGRRNRGRMYWPMSHGGETFIDQTGTLAGALVTSWQGWLSGLMTELNARGLTPVLFHSDGSASTEITSFSIDTKVATQRTRLRR